MDKIVEREYERLKQETNALLKEVSALSSQTYHYKPGLEKWSIAQILTHIVTSEELSVLYMLKKIQGVSTLDDTGIIEEIKMLVLKISLRIPAIKLKAPPVLLERTPPPMTYGDLVRHWDALRTRMAALLDQIESPYVHRKIYKHPFAGRLSVVHALQFFRAHLAHHHSQIKAISKTIRADALRNANPSNA